MAWDSAHKTNLHKVHLKEKNAVRLICNENKFAHTHAISTDTNYFLKKTFKKFLCSCIVSKLVVMCKIL